MKREWSFHRSNRGRKRVLFLVVGGVILFILGFFAARPLCSLFGIL